MPGHRVTETQLFKLLRKRESSDGFEAAQISSRVNGVVEEAWPLLHQISRSFPFYTLHDPEHSFRVAQLNSIELSILLYAAYLHDIGYGVERSGVSAMAQFAGLRRFSCST